MLLLTPAEGELGDDALARLYGYPAERGQWLRANMVSSADGAGFLDGLSGGLSSAADRRLFGVLRALADVILVGAGTARAEGYGPAKRRAALAGLRAGRTATPPIALVSRTLELDFTAPLFTEAPPDARTIVITCAASPEAARTAAARVADVIMAGDLTVDLGAAMAALGKRGHGRVLCEGGPHLLGQAAAAGLLDELCLSVSPLLAGPGAPRIIAGSPFPARPMTLAHVLETDGFLFCRYLAENTLSPGELQTGDAFLASFVPKLINSTEYQAGNTAIFITWDEGGGSNQVLTEVIAPTVTPGTQSGMLFTHYSLLRTTEELLGLPYIGQAATANSMRDAFGL